MKTIYEFCEITGKFATIHQKPGSLYKNGFIVNNIVISAYRVNRIFWQPKTEILHFPDGHIEILEIEE